MIFQNTTYMRKVIAIAAFVSLVMSSCSNDAPLNKQEEKTVDSLVTNEQDAMDSLEAAIKAQIGTDSLSDDSIDMD